MKCRSCKHCELLSQTTAWCHGLPPFGFHQQWFKANGDSPPKIDNRDEHWVQLYPLTPSSAWTPIKPTWQGCSLHRFSLRRLLQWRRLSPNIQLRPDITQDKLP